MAAFLTQQSQPLHLENTLLTYGNDALSINNAFDTYREMKMDGVIRVGQSVT